MTGSNNRLMDATLSLMNDLSNKRYGVLIPTQNIVPPYTKEVNYIKKMLSEKYSINFDKAKSNEELLDTEVAVNKIFNELISENIPQVNIDNEITLLNQSIEIDKSGINFENYNFEFLFPMKKYLKNFI